MAMTSAAIAARPRPYQKTCQRRSRSVLTRTLRRGTSGLLHFGLRCRLVVGEEDLLQARLLRAQVEDAVAGDGLQGAVQVVAHLQVDEVAVAAQLAHAGQREGVGRHRLAEADLDDVQGAALEVRYRLDGDDLAVTDDADAVADPLHLGEDVRGEEDGG